MILFSYQLWWENSCFTHCRIFMTRISCTLSRAPVVGEDGVRRHYYRLLMRGWLVPLLWRPLGQLLPNLRRVPIIHPLHIWPEHPPHLCAEITRTRTHVRRWGIGRRVQTVACRYYPGTRVNSLCANVARCPHVLHMKRAHQEPHLCIKQRCMLTHLKSNRICVGNGWKVVAQVFTIATQGGVCFVHILCLDFFFLSGAGITFWLNEDVKMGSHERFFMPYGLKNFSGRSEKEVHLYQVMMWTVNRITPTIAFLPPEY